MKITHEEPPQHNQFAEYVVEKRPTIVDGDVLVGAEKQRVPLDNFVSDDKNPSSLETVLEAYQKATDLQASEITESEIIAIAGKYHDDVVSYVTQSKSAVDVIEKLAEVVSYPDWVAGEAVAVGDVRMYETNLYTVIQPHKTQSDWTPDITPALWKRFYTADEIPEWVQPAGAHDAYNTGDRVTYNGKTWESTVDANVWAPGVYGWTEVKE